jgi:muramoyltetrapeptide carboxypeptidase
LKAGDTIRVVTPASPLTPDRMAAGVAQLEAAGFKVEMAEHALDSTDYVAGDAKTRAADLYGAFMDPSVHAVFCSRGGYGCSHLVPLLDFDAIAEQRKLFLGFSDITVLHLALNRRGLPTVYGPMPITLGPEKEPWVFESLLAAVKGTPVVPAGAPTAQTVVGGTAEGVVTGGTLCLIADAIATAEPLDARGKIVLIEDVDEDSYRIDAMLTHLVQAGALAGAAGIVVGEMTRTDERPAGSMGSRPWREIVADILGPLGLPLVVDYPFGHCKNMLSLPLGISARLDADQGTLTYIESLCE